MGVLSSRSRFRSSEVSLRVSHEILNKSNTLLINSISILTAYRDYFPSLASVLELSNMPTQSSIETTNALAK